MEIGIVKSFNDARGFGFIEREGDSRDIFCHFSYIINQRGRKTLTPGDRVEFEIEETERGLMAVNVARIED